MLKMALLFVTKSTPAPKSFFTSAGQRPVLCPLYFNSSRIRRLQRNGYCKCISSTKRMRRRPVWLTGTDLYYRLDLEIARILHCLVKDKRLFLSIKALRPARLYARAQRIKNHSPWPFARSWLAAPLRLNLFAAVFPWKTLPPLVQETASSTGLIDTEVTQPTRHPTTFFLNFILEIKYSLCHDAFTSLVLDSFSK